jgi:large subunit ribosomal protein L3
MIPAILGKKIGMTQVYDETGKLHPVTVVQAGPCSVLQVKTVETDGYNAVQVGYEDIKASRATQPQIGHTVKHGGTPKAFVREVRLGEEPTDLQPGSEITVELFSEVVMVDVTGTTKGHGYSGGMRRHGFKGQLATHGVERKHRSSGSIGGHANNAGKSGKIKKGKRMSGQYGGGRQTTRNHKLVGVDTENHLLLIRGSVPGPANSYVMVRQSKAAKVS